MKTENLPAIVAILDSENDRVIVARVPEYLRHVHCDEAIEAVISALGLSVDSCQWLAGDLKLELAHDIMNDPRRSALHQLDELTQNFREDALAALEDALA